MEYHMPVGGNTETQFCYGCGLPAREKARWLQVTCTYLECVCLFVLMWASIQIYVCVCQRSVLVIIPQVPCTLFFETEPLIGLEIVK